MPTPTNPTDRTMNETETTIAAGMAMASATERVVEIADIPVAVLPPGMKVEILSALLAERDMRAAAPARRKGQAEHTELESFVAHVVRFRDEHSAIWADAEAMTLTAILDYHAKGSDGAPRWGEHRSIYACPTSDAWDLWTSRDGKAMSQDEFGAFIDDHQLDIVSPAEGEAYPAPNQVLGLARSLVVHQRGTFERTVNETTGEFSLVNKLENDAATSTRIPRAFLVGIPVFEAGTRYRIEARLRFALQGGKPMFSFHLHQVDQIKRHAFAEVRSVAAKGTGLPIFVGTPE